MLSILEISLQEALEELNIVELPKALPNEQHASLIEGIGLVTKIDGSQNYVIVVGDGMGNISVRKDFGPSMMIRNIDAVYAKTTLDAKRFMPDLRSDKQIIQFLTHQNHDEAKIAALLSKKDKSPERIKQDRETVKRYVAQEAVVIARRTLDEENRVKNIKSYADRIKHGTEEG